MPLIVAVPAGLFGPTAGSLGLTAGPGHRRMGAKILALILAGTALVVIGLPDGRRAAWMTPVLANLLQDKYVAGQVLLLVSLLGYLSHARRGTEPRADRERPRA